MTSPPGVIGLFEWMEERELIRLKKESGLLPPWTTDQILQSFYFTNVMREHDKVSRWIQANITDRYVHNPYLPIMLGVARWINKPETLQYLLDNAWIENGSYRELIDMVEALDRYKGKIWSGAYIISANGMRYGNWKSKHQYVLLDVIGRMGTEWDLRSMQMFTQDLDYQPGWGGFMAYEVACDLRWAPGWLDKAPDIYTWANPGPGAMRGLMDVYGLNRAPNKETCISMMLGIFMKAEEHTWGIPWTRRLEMRDIEHSLCEFNKYMNVRRWGRAKRRYPPRHR